MAGIGYGLRKLALQGDLLGFLQGFTYSVLIAAGPWLFTSFCLAGISLLGAQAGMVEELATFRLIVTYNFAFSLVFSGPVSMVVTRYLADRIYARDVQEAPGMMLGALVLSCATQLLFAVPLYFFYASLPLGIQLAAVANYFLVTSIWVVAVFLTALKEYRAVSGSFAVGMLLTLGGSIVFMKTYSVTSTLLAFNTGLAVILFSLVARVFAEYQYGVIRPFGFLGHFKEYWELALGGLVYNTAVWADKWVMWFSPYREVSRSGLVSYPDYDSAMFLAYLSIIPSLALFVFSVETDLFDHYHRFYKEIRQHANFEQIEKNHRSLVRSVLRHSRNVVTLQGTILVALLLLAPVIFARLHLNYEQMGMFRLGLLGAFFHVIFVFLSVLLFYFDVRRSVLLLQVLFLSTNVIFTLATMKMGFAFYGYGFFLSGVVTFLAAFFVVGRFLRELPYHAFIDCNPSVPTGS